jgi:hypothetical protein
VSAALLHGAEERRALLDRYAVVVEGLLHIRGAWTALDTLAVYVIDLLDPLGHVLGHALHKHCKHPDPALITRRSLSMTPPVRPIALGLMSACRLGTLAARLGYGFADAAVELCRGEAPSQHVRVLVVAGAWAELMDVPVVTGTAPVGSA